MKAMCSLGYQHECFVATFVYIKYIVLILFLQYLSTFFRHRSLATLYITPYLGGNL